MYENNLIFRVFLRRKLRKLPTDQRKYVRQVLDDEDLCDVVCSKVEQTAGAESEDVVTFLEWLLAHWEEILKVIMTIIDLFSKE